MKSGSCGGPVGANTVERVQSGPGEGGGVSHNLVLVRSESSGGSVKARYRPGLGLVKVQSGPGVGVRSGSGVGVQSGTGADSIRVWSGGSVRAWFGFGKSLVGVQSGPGADSVRIWWGLCQDLMQG
jgi:hypothetical protein